MEPRIMSRVLTSLMLLTVVCLLAVPAAAQEGEEPEIVRRMENMNDILRQMRRQARDAANKASLLDLIEEFRGHALAAQKETPPKTSELPESEREAFIEKYRQTMDRMLSTLDKFKAAVEAGRVEQANQLVRRLYDWKKEGHEEFQTEDDSR